MNFDDYIQSYSGYGVTVTIIDTGVMLERENITHYRYQNGEIIDSNVISFDSIHATICAETILRIAPNVNINDICIEEKGIITENALISALNFANANLESDIICICLALDEYSINLVAILEKFEKTFIFASGHKSKVSYPSDLGNVTKVYYDRELSGVKIVSKKKIAVNFETIQSSSLACAYISGLFSVILEAKALWQFDDIKNWIFPDITRPVINQKIFLPEEFVALFPSKYHEFKNNFIENLIGYYDEDMILRDFRGIQLQRKYKSLHINTDERQKMISPAILGDYFVGNFINDTSDNKIQLLNHYAVESDYICEIEQPIMALASFGYGSSKFDLQIRMNRNISKLSYSATYLTYNPMGILFKDFVVFEYPKQIICPNLIYSINRSIYELSITNNIDIFILNIGGSIRSINYHNSYDMGMLFEAYLKAFRVDIILLCVTINVSIDVVLFEIERLKATGITEVIVVVSDNQYDTATYESSTGIKYFKCSSEKQKAYAKKLSEKYCIDLVYLLNDFDSPDVVETIVRKLT